MGIISVENSDRLFWLGRYSERVYITISLFKKSFDAMIDFDEHQYEEFCRRLDIPCIYESKDDFIRRYCFDGENPNSIYANLQRAYDNAIVLREEIGSETLAYIQLAVYEMNRAAQSEAPLVPLQKVQDNLVAFWGQADDSIEDQLVRNDIKIGKRVERLDLYARLQMNETAMTREIHRLAGRIENTSLHYSKTVLKKLEEAVEKMDYREIVTEVEALVEG